MKLVCRDCGYSLAPCPSCGVLICNCEDRSKGRVAPDFEDGPRLRWRKHWYNPSALHATRRPLVESVEVRNCLDCGRGVVAKSALRCKTCAQRRRRAREREVSTTTGKET